MRISDADRQAALEVLAEHLTAGRITLDEYGERSAHIMVARTADDLAEQFDDLPAPHPVLSTGRPAAALAPSERPALPKSWSAPGADIAQRRDQRSRAQKVVAVAASISVFAAVALFFMTGTWLWFLLIPAISGAAKAIWGSGWNEPHTRNPRQLGKD